MENLRNLGPTRLAMLGIGLAAVLLALGYVGFGGGGKTLLVSGLDPADSAAVLEAVESAGVKADIRANGTQIWVPSSDRDRMLLHVAGEGLLTYGTIGNELFQDSSALGESSFIQRINRQRALEGELSRTLRTVKGVRGVRVHLVMPERELFSRESRPASASVVLQLSGGAKLAAMHVVAIQQLVASAVPDLQPNRISVVDDRGNVYNRGSDEGGAGASTRADQYRLDYERRLAREIEELVGNTVGLQNVHAQVSAVMDFNRETVNEEIFDPDQQVARSVQSVEESNESTETQGQDPVTVATNLPDADTAFAAGAGSFSRSNRTEETTNFDISRRVRSFVRETGIIERLSVAVLVNGSYQRAPDGAYQRGAEGNPIYANRPEEELQAFESLIVSAVGAQASRGDVVTVRSMRFHDESLFTDPRQELLLGFPKSDLYRIVEFLGLIIVAILVMLLVVRPIIARALEERDSDGYADEHTMLPESAATAAARLEESAGLAELEQMVDIGQVEGKVRASSMRKIGEIIEKNPEEAVAVLRGWMYQEASG